MVSLLRIHPLQEICTFERFAALLIVIVGEKDGASHVVLVSPAVGDITLGNGGYH